MAKAVQFRRGTSTENDNFTGLVGEVVVDTTNKELRVHDGSTKGGFAVAQKADIVSVNDTQTLTPAQAAVVLKNLHMDPTSAGFANSLYRGHPILDYFTEAQLSEKLAAGDFSDLYIGDYIEKTIGVSGIGTYTPKWQFAHFDYYLGKGDTACTTHHIVMVPSIALGNSRMKSGDITTGAFVNSEMWTTTLPKYATAIQGPFGASHVLSYRQYLSNTMTDTLATASGGASTGAVPRDGLEWADATVMLMNEAQVYGTMIYSSSGADVGCSPTQFSLFHLCPQAITVGTKYWLCGVSNKWQWCRVELNGQPSNMGGSYSYGIRPFFLYY